MPGSADRAINMPLRVQGVTAVERDFKKVGSSGKRAFEDIEKAAKKAALATGQASSAGANPLGPSAGGDSAAAISQTTKSIDVFTGSTARGAAGAQNLAGSMSRARAQGIALGIAISSTAKIVYESLQAYEEHEQALIKFEATLRLTGNSSLVAAAQIEQAAQRTKDFTGQTKEASLEAAAALAEVPGIARDVFEEALLLSGQLADALGTDIQTEAKRTGAILSAIAENDVDALYKATQGMSSQFRLAVIQLLDAGRQADATALTLTTLAEAAGDGPGGLTASTNALTDAWDNLKLSIGERFEGAAIASLNSISDATNLLADNFDNLLRLRGGGTIFIPRKKETIDPAGPDNRPSFLQTTAAEFAQSFNAGREIAARRTLESRFGKPPRRGRRRSGGNRAAREAAREAERLKKETARARAAADKVIESNDDAVASYRRRAEEAQERLGKEGEALDAVVRQQAIEAAARSLSSDLIEKEVAARRLSEGAKFDEAQATADATAKLELQSDAIREQAAALYDAEKAQAAFNRRMVEAKALAEQVRTPFEQITAEVERITQMLDAGDISADQFSRRMDQLANDLVDHAERAGNAWQGFGDDVGQTFSDIILNGGSAREILQELIRLPLERLLQQNVANPVADFVDGLTGNNRNDNVAAARGQIDSIAASSASNALLQLEVSGRQAAFALASIQPAAQQGVIVPFGETGKAAGAAGQELGELPPVTARVGQGLASLLSQISGGGGGAAGFLSTALSLASAAFGGGAVTAASTARLAGASNALITANPGIFHGGGDPAFPARTKNLQFAASPSFQHNLRNQLAPDERLGIFQTGERILSRGQNRALTNLLSAGGSSGIRGREAMRSGDTNITQNIYAPERVDPRRTAHGLARATDKAMGRARRKGLAAGPRSRS